MFDFLLAGEFASTTYYVLENLSEAFLGRFRYSLIQRFVLDVDQEASKRQNRIIIDVLDKS